MDKMLYLTLTMLPAFSSGNNMLKESQETSSPTIKTDDTHETKLKNLIQDMKIYLENKIDEAKRPYTYLFRKKYKRQIETKFGHNAIKEVVKLIQNTEDRLERIKKENKDGVLGLIFTIEERRLEKQADELASSRITSEDLKNKAQYIQKTINFYNTVCKRFKDNDIQKITTDWNNFFDKNHSVPLTELINKYGVRTEITENEKQEIRDYIACLEKDANALLLIAQKSEDGPEVLPTHKRSSRPYSEYEQEFGKGKLSASERKSELQKAYEAQRKRMELMRQKQHTKIAE